jgi:hypothetical protein
MYKLLKKFQAFATMRLNTLHADFSFINSCTGPEAYRRLRLRDLKTVGT